MRQLQGQESVTVSIQMIMSHIQRFQVMGGVLPECLVDLISENEERLINSEVRCPVLWVKYAIEYAADYLEDPVLGLNHLNGEEPFKDFTTELLLRSSNLAEFIWLYSRYFCIFTEIGDFSIIFGKNTSSVRFDPKNGDLLTYHQFDAAIYGLKITLEKARRLQPYKLLKEHAAPKGYDSAYSIERQLSCPVPRQLTWPVDEPLFAFFK